MPLQAYPPVPSQETVEADEQKGKDENDDDADLGYFDQVPAKFIDEGCVHVATKGYRILCGKWQDIGLERQAGERVIDVFLQQLKRSVNPEKFGLMQIHAQNEYLTYTDSTFCLMSATEGIVALS